MTENRTKYIEFLRSLIKQRGKAKILIDTSNGATSPYIKDVFTSNLGIECVHIGDEVSAEFPLHGADPNKKQAQDIVKAKILETGSDLGVAIDGDGDRAVIFDRNGEVVPSFVVVSAFLDDADGMGVADELTWNALRALGLEGNFARAKVGHTNIKKVMRETKAVVGGEFTGHYYFHECGGMDDAIVASIKALNVNSENPFSEYRKSFDRHKWEFENFPANWDMVQDKLKDKYGDKVEIFDGITVRLSLNEWFSARFSNTESVLRLSAGAESKDRAKEIISEIKQLLN